MHDTRTEPALNRHLAAVMFTDVKGYTALMQEDERKALQVRTHHREGVEQVASEFGGRVLQYFGDGSLSIFPSAVEGVRAAVSLQELARTSGSLSIRVGLHVGDIAYDTQGAYGDAVNVAARIEALCSPGGVLVSGRVASELLNHPELPTRSLGTVQLKNVREPVELHAVDAPGLVVSELDPRVARVTEDALSPEGRSHLEAVLGRSPRDPRGTGGADVTPFVGRERELAELESLLERSERGVGGVVFLRGLRGVGKSRVAEEVAAKALERGWWITFGRSYPAERRMAFAPFADALLPVLRGLSAADRRVLAPGAESILGHVFPTLGPPPDGGSLRFSEPGELQTRIFWQLSTLLGNLARRHPLLFVLEDAQWADPSSLELFHFLARQSAASPVLFLCVYAEADREQERALQGLERSLRNLGQGVFLEIPPLTAEATVEMLAGVLGRTGAAVDALGERLHRWTGGNAFFIQGVLEELIESGRLAPGATPPEELEKVEMSMPRSVRQAVMERVSRLGEDARAVAELMAVLGARTTHDVLGAVTDLSAEVLTDAMDELERHRVVVESEVGPAVAYDFAHPLIAEAIRSELSLARRRSLHYRIGTRLESYLGPRAPSRSDELAYHFARAHPGQAGEKATHYLVAAGRQALVHYANREAAGYFRDALDRLDASGDTASAGAEEGGRVVEGLAKALTRLGEYDQALRMWNRALGLRRAAGDLRREARIRREIGLMFLWSDRIDEALEELSEGVSLAREAGDDVLAAAIQLAVSLCHQHAGRPADARGAAEDAMEVARRVGDPSLQARALSSLLRLQIWTGELRDVRAHAEEALESAREAGDPAVEFWMYWALAVAEGLFGNIHATEPRIAEARRIAREVGSPILGLWVDEFMVEHCYSLGRWRRGLETGERAIRLARDLNQRTVLPRLLVWTSLIHIGRGNFERARELTDEAWEVSNAGGMGGGRTGPDLHTVVPAHIGRAAYHCALGDWDEAIRLGELGAELAERSGYVVWGLHRLLPILAEAHIHARNLDQARRVAVKMRDLSQGIGHDLGLAWAGACEAVLTWLEGDAEKGARQLASAADALEEIPMIWEAARLRRQLAGRLAEIGDPEGAREQLDQVYVTCVELGAQGELSKALRMYEEIGAEPPMLGAGGRPLDLGRGGG